ncbi:MAG: hypothetical protein ABIK07_06440, partial [Planctomycetota bacterium]
MSKKTDLKLRNQYRGQFETCEVSRHMPPADLWVVRKLGTVAHLEVHHIFSRGCIRVVSAKQLEKPEPDEEQE